jgi:hypothetical protein
MDPRCRGKDGYRGEGMTAIGSGNDGHENPGVTRRQVF